MTFTSLPYEDAVLLNKHVGRFFLQWRRQGHKTTTLSRCALRFMMRHPGSLVTFTSASLLVGSELIHREGQVVHSVREKIWSDAQAIRAAFAAAAGDMTAPDEPEREATAVPAEGKSILKRRRAAWAKMRVRVKLETNADGLHPDDVADLFETQKLEARLWHSQTVCSRTLIIAPNPATARSWSGCVIIDEAGHIADLADLLEAMEPIMSADPEFRLLMAGTPPNDDLHFSYQLTLPPEGATFTPDPRGHWYVSQAGLLVHRVDAWDAAAAGLKTFDPDTRAPVTPERHRAKALDREAWDRNYALIFKPGGAAAVTLDLLQHAMARGRSLGLFAEDDFPTGWREFLGDGPIAIGFDPATTERKASNPSALAIMEQTGGLFIVRLLLVFKTADPELSRALLREALDLGAGRRPRRLCIDATNERYFATGLKQELAGRVHCELVVASEKTARAGEELTLKTLLGSQLIRYLEDDLVALPDARYVRDDFRLVVRERGGFDNQLDKQGRHGDTFDAVKLALHGLLVHAGPKRPEAVPLGSPGGEQAPARRWKNPYARMEKRGVVV